MNTTYPKIETLFDRNPENMKHVILGQVRDPAFALVDSWLVTEKIDGTNVRVIYEDGQVRFGGRTDDAQMPVTLLDFLRATFSLGLISGVWPSTSDGVHDAEHPRVVLYGEGYGAKIQKGGNYRSTTSFRLFDVAVWGDDGRGGEKWWWLNWDNIVDVAAKLGLKTVPLLARGITTSEAVGLVSGFSKVTREEGDLVKEHPYEGIVCRTDPLLFTRRGDRLMWKLKGRDLPV